MKTLLVSKARRARATVSALLSLGLLLGASAQADTLKLPVPELETLPNGLQLAWFVSESLPVVDMIMVVKSGYRDDPSGKSGTAELVGALLDRGAGGLTAQQIAQTAERIGASRYAGADDDTFSIGMHGLAPDAPVLLDLMSKMALHPDFPQAEVNREQARILDRLQHVGDYSETLVSTAFSRALAAGTSYGRGSFASIAEFNRVKREDVIAYHRKNFTPRNSILMIVGRVDKKEFRKKIEEQFGNWQGEAPARTYGKYSDPRVKTSPDQILLIDRPGLNQAQVRLGFRAPLIKAPEHYSLVVANALLGEYFHSRLNTIIRDKLGLTYGIGSSFGYSKDLARFAVSSSSRNETVGQLIQKTLEILQGLKKGPIPAQEVQMAKDYLIGGFPLSVQTLGAVASRWISGYIFDRGPDYLNEFEPKISAIDPSAVQESVRKDFDLQNRVTVVAGDAKDLEPILKKSGFKVKRISAKDLL